MTYDPRSATGIPTEPVGSLPRPSKLQAAYADYDAGKISHEQLEAEQDEAVQDSIGRMEATGSPIVSDGEQRWSSFATYPITDTLAGTGLAPNLAPRRPVLRDLRRRAPPAAAAPDRRPVPLQDLRRRHAGEVDPVREQADEAGRDRAVDARPALPAGRGGPRLLARGSSRTTWSTSARRTSAGRSRPAPRGSRSTSPKGGWRPAPTRATRGPAPACCRTSSSSTTACSTASRPRSARTSACTPARRRPRLGAQRRRALQRPAAEPVQDERRLLPDPVRQRARQGPGLEADRRAQPRRRQRRAADLLPRRDRHAEPAGRERAGDLRPARPRRRTSSRRSGSARPTTAASRRSASTRSRTTARRTTPARSRSRRSSQPRRGHQDGGGSAWHRRACGRLVSGI